jgi:hypothetical protein
MTLGFTTDYSGELMGTYDGFIMKATMKRLLIENRQNTYCNFNGKNAG